LTVTQASDNLEENIVRTSIIEVEDASLLILDNVFSKPKQLLEQVRKLSFDTQMGFYPGLHCFTGISNRLLIDWLNDQSEKAGSPIQDFFPGKIKPQEKYKEFAFAVTLNRFNELMLVNSHPHTDHFCDYSILVYLYDDDDVNGGTHFWKNLKTDSIWGPISDELLDSIHPDEQIRGYNLAGASVWELMEYVPAIMNRMVIFPGSMFHSPTVHADPRPLSSTAARISLNCHVDIK